MKMRALFVWCVATGAVLTFVSRTRAQTRPEVQELFRRMFKTDEFEPKRFGPASWLEEGNAYTTVEPSATMRRLRR